MTDDGTTRSGTEALEEVRRPAVNPHAFRGFGPLLALAVLVLLSVLLAPTVAPERVVEVPSDRTTTSAPTPGTTGATTATTAADDGVSTTGAGPTTEPTAEVEP